MGLGDMLTMLWDARTQLGEGVVDYASMTASTSLLSITVGAAARTKSFGEELKNGDNYRTGALLAGFAAACDVNPPSDWASPVYNAFGVGVYGASAGAVANGVVRPLLSSTRALGDNMKREMFKGAVLAGPATTAVYSICDYFF